MLHIIGLNHGAQALRIGEEPTEEQRRFSECLLRTIEQVRPTLIAEEDSEDTLRRRQSISIAKGIADEKGIEHRFCDPTIDERQEMGYRDGVQLEIRFWGSGLSDDESFCKARAIEIGRYFPIRERFWMDRLDGIGDVDAIFICGDFHIEAESFRRILEAENVPYRIVERGIGAVPGDARYHNAINIWPSTLSLLIGSIRSKLSNNNESEPGTCGLKLFDEDSCLGRKRDQVAQARPRL